MKRMYLYPFEVKLCLQDTYENDYASSLSFEEAYQYVYTELSKEMDEFGMKEYSIKLHENRIMMYVFVKIPNSLPNPENYMDDIRFILQDKFPRFHFKRSELAPIAYYRLD